MLRRIQLYLAGISYYFRQCPVKKGRSPPLPLQEKKSVWPSDDCNFRNAVSEDRSAVVSRECLEKTSVIDSRSVDELFPLLATMAVFWQVKNIPERWFLLCLKIYYIFQ